MLLLGYAYYRTADMTGGLASIGLLSFAAVAQMAPSLFGGMVWRQANARGAILGMSIGFLVWAYLLFLPSLGGPDYSWVAGKVLHFLFPSPPRARRPGSIRSSAPPCSASLSTASPMCWAR